jgi:hypothetical protein
MTTMFNKSRVEGFTPQGLVVHQAMPLMQHPPSAKENKRYEGIPPSFGLDHLFVDTGNLAFYYTGSKREYGDKIFVHFNGMEIETYTKNRSRNYKNPQMVPIRFAGAVMHSQKAGMKPGPVSISTQGTATTFNNSGKTIHMGQLIKFKMPPPTDRSNHNDVVRNARSTGMSDWLNQKALNKGMIGPLLEGYWPHRTRQNNQGCLLSQVKNAGDDFAFRSKNILFSTDEQHISSLDVPDEKYEIDRFEEACDGLLDVFKADSTLKTHFETYIEIVFKRLDTMHEIEQACTIGKAVATSKRGTQLNLQLSA